MKTLYVLFLFPLILLCSCSNSQDSKTIVSTFTANYTAEYNGLELSGCVTANNESVTNISFDSPETISGLNVNYKGSQMQISRESLICSADEAYIPQNSFPSTLKSILKAVSDGRADFISESELENTYVLDTVSGECELKTDKDGYIKQAYIKECEFKIIFTENKSADN